MDNLPRVIGPAPSELPADEFIYHRLNKERARQERSLAAFRSGVVPSWDKKKKKKAPARKRAPGIKKKAAAVDRLEAILAGGLSLDELEKKGHPAKKAYAAFQKIVKEVNAQYK